MLKILKNFYHISMLSYMKSKTIKTFENDVQNILLIPLILLILFRSRLL